jgi:serine/threonine protein kinase/predicted Zn-dependent protease
MSSSHRYYQFDSQCDALLVDFDQARRGNPDVNVQATVAQAPVQHQPWLIAELACIDLEHAFEQGQAVEVTRFLKLYPDVFAAAELREEVAQEHYRLCRLFGIQIARADVAQRYGLSHATWDELPQGTSHATLPDSSRYPQVGSTFCGYPIFAELGRGALARVVLAQQPDLAQRWVVLKITQQPTTEAEHLASLQHSGIIPVYSIHQEDDLYCICMPYLGAVTLASLLADGRLFSHSYDIRQQFVSTLVANRWSTIAATIRNPVETPPPPKPTPPAAGRSSEPTALAVGCSCEPTALAAGDFPHIPPCINPPLAPSADSSNGTDFEERLGLSDLALALQEQYLNRDALAAKVLLAQQLTESIGYAHSRGVVHSDLKPENILIANDGRPVVLDFNLASSDSISQAIRAGGTLPYMSPQQLRSLDKHSPASPQDDVFAIGVILYQLLTGRLPFDDSHLPTDNWEAIATNHSQPPLDARSADRSIPPSLNAIVMKCLATSFDERYRSAIEVHEDLQRFARHEVLKHAPDRSPVERLQKFVKRHPTLTSTSSIVVAATVAVAALVSGLLVAQARVAKLEASHLASSLHEDAPETLALLCSPGGESELLQDGIERARETLKQWSVSDDQQQFASTLRLLSADKRADARQQIGSLSYALAGAEVQLAMLGEGAQRTSLLSDATQWNLLSAEMLPELDGIVRWRERRIDELLEPSERPSATSLDSPPAESTFAQMLAAREAGDNQLWRRYAEQLVNQRPSDPTHWFSLASARYAAGDLTRAHEAFDVSAKLQKDSAMSVFWRGMTGLRTNDFAQASEDFSQVIAMRANWLAPRYNRALAYQGLRKFSLAIDDLNWIVHSGQAGPRVFSLRSQIHAAMNEREKAIEDRKLALLAPARDADDWVSLGVLKIQQAPTAALQDFAQALRLSPRNVAARFNTAHVQSEVLHDNEAAITTLSTLIEARLGGTSAVASRGILEARLGRRQDALADAVWAAQTQPTALEMLQIAGIYALTSTQTNDDQLALSWLARALSMDPTLGKMAQADPDLIRLRELPAFEVLVAIPTLAD